MVTIGLDLHRFRQDVHPRGRADPDDIHPRNRRRHQGLQCKKQGPEKVGAFRHGAGPCFWDSSGLRRCGPTAIASLSSEVSSSAVHHHYFSCLAIILGLQLDDQPCDLANNLGPSNFGPVKQGFDSISSAQFQTW